MGNSQNNPAKEEDYLKLLLNHQVDGLIVGSHNQGISEYQKTTRPIVSIERYVGKQIPVVSSDNYQGAYLPFKGCLTMVASILSILTTQLTWFYQTNCVNKPMKT